MVRGDPKDIDPKDVQYRSCESVMGPYWDFTGIGLRHTRFGFCNLKIIPFQSGASLLHWGLGFRV